MTGSAQEPDMIRNRKQANTDENEHKRLILLKNGRKGRGLNGGLELEETHGLGSMGFGWRRTAIFGGG